MGGWGTVGAHRLMGAQMSQEGLLLPRIPMHVSSQRMERASSFCVFGSYWVLAFASGTGKEAAGRAILCRHSCPHSIWRGVLLLAPCYH